MEYLVSAPHPLEGRRITEVSDNYVEWNLERREELQMFQLTHSHVNRCPRELYAVEGDDKQEERISSSGKVYKKRKLSDGTSENSEDDPEGRPVSYPYGARPYKPRQSCSWREN